MSKTHMIDIGLMDQSSARRLAEKLNGKTYMNFQVIVAPYACEVYVSVQSGYDGTEEEVREMFIYLMATELSA